MMKLTLIAMILVLGTPAFGAEPHALLNGLIFHAPFDGSADARVAAGDGRIHTAPPGWDVAKSTPGLSEDAVALATGEGRYGDALHFQKKTKSMVFFYGDKNTGYRAKNWSGTVSMWLLIDPADLKQQFADPIQITDKRYNDSALWVDFTKDDTPPDFRLGVFADKNVWNPNGLKQSEMPESELPMVRVEEPPFSRSAWTHVVMTFSNFNTDGTHATAELYVNGELQGTIKDRHQVFTWDVSKVSIRLGLGYVGLFDELAIYDRALKPNEVQALYELPAGLAGLSPPGK